MLKIILCGNCVHAKFSMYASVRIGHYPLSANSKAAKIHKHHMILCSRKLYSVDISSVAYIAR